LSILKRTKLRNRFEKKIYRWLKRHKVVFTYESERIAYVLAKHYIPDFIIQTKWGKIYVEAKGYLRPEDKQKLLAVRRQHPYIDLRIVFYRSCPTNIRWAERNRIRYAIETIPIEWLEGM
jgi:predicted nuclease of restriction endonuclease-like RecB superfamily